MSTATPDMNRQARHRAVQVRQTREERMWREVTTPEGAIIRMRLADASERAVALLIDAAIMLVTSGRP